jgi:hemolysin D
MSLSTKVKNQLTLFQRERLGWLSGPPAVLREAVPFQNDIDAIVDEPPPRWMRGATFLVASLLVLLIVIASVVQVETVVRASGQLTADQPIIVLQPIERSLIRELKVKAGDIVTKGQVLATLDATFSQADLNSLTEQQGVLSARIQRVETELNGPLPAKTLGNLDDALQTSLYRERMAQYASRLRAFDEAIRQGEAGIRTTQDEHAALSKQIAIAKDVEKLRSTLVDAGLGSRTQYLDSQSISLHTQREYQTAGNRLVELRHEVETRKAERESFINQWRGELLENLGRDRSELAKVKDSVSKAARLRDLIAITAPEDGVVLDVAMRSVGSVMREAEPLVSLMPSNAALIADVMVASDEIGYIQPGDKVVVKVDAFPYQRHGTLHGVVRSIGEQSIPGGSRTGEGQVVAPPGGPYHRVQVELTRTNLQGLPNGVRLIPGMTVTGEVGVGKRTIITYLLYPITRGFDESIREP